MGHGTRGSRLSTLGSGLGFKGMATLTSLGFRLSTNRIAQCGPHGTCQSVEIDWTSGSNDLEIMQ